MQINRRRSRSIVAYATARPESTTSALLGRGGPSIVAYRRGCGTLTHALPYGARQALQEISPDTSREVRLGGSVFGRQPPLSAGLNNRNANIAIGLGRIKKNCIITTPHSHIDARLTELQVAQNYLIQKRWQARIAQPDFSVERIEF